jgi:hypothetical protein
LHRSKKEILRVLELMIEKTQQEVIKLLPEVIHNVHRMELQKSKRFLKSLLSLYHIIICLAGRADSCSLY